MKKFEFFATNVINYGKPYDIGTTLFARTIDKSEGYYVTIYPDHWKVNPLVQSLGDGQMPCNPIITHHIPSAKTPMPELIAQIPPPETWKKLNWIPNFGEAYPELVEKFGRVDTRKFR